MAHIEQQQFCEKVKSLFPEYFDNVNVLDVGSLDINGNNRYLFTNSNYTGLDIGPGRNVDIVKPVHEFAKCGFLESRKRFDIVISCEMLEHDKYRDKSLMAMVKLLRKGGLLLITAAYYNRAPHGITCNKPEDSPFTNDYYQNIGKLDFRGIISKLDRFDIQYNPDFSDIYFWGIKK